MNRNHFVQILMFLAVFVLIPVKNSDASWSDWLEKGQTVLNQAVEKAQELGGQASKGASQLVSWGKARYNQATAPDIELISCMASEKKGWLDAINPAFSAANPKIKVKTEIAGSGTLVADVNSGNKLGCDILSTASSISTVLLEGGHRAVSYLVFSPTVVIADQERAAVMRTYFQETYKSDAITLVRLAKVLGIIGKRLEARKVGVLSKLQPLFLLFPIVVSPLLSALAMRPQIPMLV
jgi:ABC-type molybdate transport system substrate-binding protein